jgi:cell division protein FtsI/penicillin-binding protein 2
VNFKKALAVSCNVGFADLTNKVGGGTMEDYVDKLGLTTSYDIDGIHNAKGSFEFPSMDKLSLAWAGIGQWKDQLNPCSMMVYMSAIATDGRGTIPKFLHDAGEGQKTERMIEQSTAKRLGKMMRNNVKKEYGEWNYPDLKLHAKTGTAEVGKGKEPNAWFAGYIDNKNYPYAFIVCVENGGVGSEVAGPVANTVLQKVIATKSAATPKDKSDR